MEVTFLGTGAGIPSKNRNVSSVALHLLQETNEIWLFDCGEATQHQLLHTTIKPRKINKIFITHLHGDHIFGLPGFLSSRSFQGGTEPITIYGPKGIKDFVTNTLSISDSHLTYDIDFVELEHKGEVLNNNLFTVDTVLLDHGVPSFGYRVKEKDRLGKLDATKLKTLGISPGPIYQKIKENETTLLEDGRLIKQSDVLGKPKKGKQVAIFGDTRYLPEHASFIQGSDLLIHEATMDATLEELAYKYHHSTSQQAAKLAKEAGVRSLILTHISSRYQADEVSILLEQAKAIFPNSYLASDYFHFKISKKG